jgi:hypothetical protein
MFVCAQAARPRKAPGQAGRSFHSVTTPVTHFHLLRSSNSVDAGTQVACRHLAPRLLTFTTSTYFPLPRSTCLHKLSPTSTFFSQTLLATARFLTSTLTESQNHSKPRQASLTRPQRLHIDSAALRATRGSPADPIPLFARVDRGKANYSIRLFLHGGAGLRCWVMGMAAFFQNDDGTSAFTYCVCEPCLAPDSIHARDV